MSDEVGRVALGLSVDTSGLEKSVNAAAKKSSNALTKSFEQSGDRIQQILSDTERSMSSKAASIAAIYKKQGMSSSEAMSKAWEQIERECGSATGAANGATRAFSGLSNAIKRVGIALGAALSVKALTSFGQQCIELGSDLAEVQNVVDVTFPAMSAKVDEFAQSAAKSFGLSETMAKKFSGTFGSMAEAFGFSEQAAYDMSTTLAGLAGDVASFYNISQDEAYTKLKSVFSGETETLKDLGIVMTQSALDAYAMANGYGKVTAKMTEQEKVSLRYAFVLDQLSNATGDFYRTQDSWANQSRTLALQAQSAMAAVGQGLINLLTPAIRALNWVMERVVAAAQAFRDLTAAIMGNAGQSVAGNLDSASSSASALGDHLTAASQAGQQLDDATGVASKSLGKSSKAAQALKRSLEGFDQITRVSAQDSGSSGSGGSGGGLDAGGISGALDGLGKTVDSVEGKTSQLTGAFKAFADFVNGLDFGPLQAAWGNLTQAAGELGEVLTGALQWGLENVLAPLAEWTIEEAAPALVESLASCLNALAAACELLGPVAAAVWDNFLAPLAKWTGDAVVAFLDGVTGAFNALSESLQSIKDLASGKISLMDALSGIAADWALFGIEMKVNAEKLEDDLVKTILGEPLYNEICRDLQNISEAIGDWIEGAKDWVVSIPVRFEETKKSLAKKWDKITSGIEEKVGELSAKATTKASEVKNWWSGVTQWWKDKTSKLWMKTATAASSVKSWWSGVTQWWKEKTVSLRAKAVTTAQEIRSAWNNISKWWKDKKASFTISIASKISDLKSWFNSSVIGPLNSKIHKVPFLRNVSIPYLAQGGYVRANTPQLAIIGDNRHQGEIVAPEDKLQEMAMAAARAASGGDTGRLEALLRAILDALQGMDLVRIDPESLRRYFIQQTNRNTKATGNCELYT